MPSEFKPAYLIHGDDHGRIAERRGRLRALAEHEGGAAGAELLEGEEASPDRVANAVRAMTFALGRRFIIVDGAERFKERELEPLEEALGALPPETTVAFFAREDSRQRAPKRLHEAVARAGGIVSAENGVKPWELPKWVIERAAEQGLHLEPDAARALVAHVGERQQRLLRELEKLALETGPDATVEAAEVEERTAPSSERRAWTLADALLAGDLRAATGVMLALRSQGERIPSLLYWMGQRLRQAHDVARALEAGQAASQVRRGLRMPPRAAERLISDAERMGSERLRLAIAEIADLELASRGGSSSGTGEDTAALLALRRATA